MSLPFVGTLGRGAGGIKAAIDKHIKISNIKAVKAITATYDPWNEINHHASAREFMYHIKHEESVVKNPDCKFNTIIVNDRREPTVECDIINGEKVIIKTANFTALEILQLFNAHVTPHAPVSEEELLQSKVRRKGKKK